MDDKEPTMDRVSATLIFAVPAARVFAVLADPTTHAAIDGTGWVSEPVRLRPPRQLTAPPGGACRTEVPA